MRHAEITGGASRGDRPFCRVLLAPGPMAPGPEKIETTFETRPVRRCDRPPQPAGAVLARDRNGPPGKCPGAYLTAGKWPAGRAAETHARC